MRAKNSIIRKTNPSKDQENQVTGSSKFVSPHNKYFGNEEKSVWLVSQDEWINGLLQNVDLNKINEDLKSSRSFARFPLKQEKDHSIRSSKCFDNYSIKMSKELPSNSVNLDESVLDKQRRHIMNIERLNIPFSKRRDSVSMSCEREDLVNIDDRSINTLNMTEQSVMEREQYEEIPVSSSNTSRNKIRRSRKERSKQTPSTSILEASRLEDRSRSYNEYIQRYTEPDMPTQMNNIIARNNLQGEEYSFDMSIGSKQNTEGDLYNLSYPVSLSTLLSKLNICKKDQESKTTRERGIEEQEYSSCEVERSLLIKPVDKENTENLEALYQSLKREEKQNRSENRIEKLNEKIDSVFVKALKTEYNLNMPLVRTRPNVANNTNIPNNLEIKKSKSKTRQNDVSQESSVRSSLIDIKNQGFKTTKAPLMIMKTNQNQDKSLKNRDINRSAYSQEKGNNIRYGQNKSVEKTNKTFMEVRNEIKSLEYTKNAKENRNYRLQEDRVLQLDSYHKKTKTNLNNVKENSVPAKLSTGTNTKRNTNEKGIINEKRANGGKNQPKRVSLEEAYQMDLERKKRLAEQFLKKSDLKEKKNTKLNIPLFQQRVENAKNGPKETNRSVRNQYKLTEEGSFCNQSVNENGTSFLMSSREKLENKNRKKGKSLEKSFQGKRKLDDSDFVNLNTSRLVLQNRDSTMFNSSSIMSNFQSFIGSFTDRTTLNEQKQRAKSAAKSTKSLNKKIVSNISKDKLQKITQGSGMTKEVKPNACHHKKQELRENSCGNETRDWTKALSYLKTVIKLESVNKNWESLTHRTNETVNDVKLEQEKQEECNLPKISSIAKDFEKEEERKMTTYFTCASFDEIPVPMPEQERCIQEEPDEEKIAVSVHDTSIEPQVRSEEKEQEKIETQEVEIQENQTRKILLVEDKVKEKSPLLVIREIEDKAARIIQNMIRKKFKFGDSNKSSSLNAAPKLIETTQISQDVSSVYKEYEKLYNKNHALFSGEGAKCSRQELEKVFLAVLSYLNNPQDNFLKSEEEEEEA